MRFLSPALPGHHSRTSSDAYFVHKALKSVHVDQQQQPPPATTFQQTAEQEAHRNAHLGFATDDLDPLALRLLADGVHFFVIGSSHRQERRSGSDGLPCLLVRLPGGINIQVEGHRLTTLQPREQEHQGQQHGAWNRSNGTTTAAEDSAPAHPAQPLPPLRPLTVSHLSYASSQQSAAAEFLRKVTGTELTGSRDAGSEVKKLRLPKFELRVLAAGHQQHHHHQQQQQQQEPSPNDDTPEPCEGGDGNGAEKGHDSGGRGGASGSRSLDAASLSLCIGFEVASLEPFLERLREHRAGEPHEYELLGPGAERGGSSLPCGPASPWSLVVRAPDGMMALELMLGGTAAARGPAALAAADDHDLRITSMAATEVMRAWVSKGNPESNLPDQKVMGSPGERDMQPWQQQQEQQNHQQQHQKHWEERIRQRMIEQEHQKQEQEQQKKNSQRLEKQEQQLHEKQQQQHWKEQNRHRQQHQTQQQQQQRKHWEERIRQRQNTKQEEEEDETGPQIPPLLYRFSSFATPVPHTRCSQTRVRPPRDWAGPRHGRGLAPAPAEDGPRPAGPWYGWVEHQMVLGIPTYDFLETRPPGLGLLGGRFARVSR